MKPVLTLAFKEFRHFFSSPIAYVFISVFLLIGFGLYFGSVFLVGETSLRIFFTWLPVLFIVLLPAVTMGMWAEEKKSGTFELLMTLPVPDWQVVLGKFLAGKLFLLVVTMLTLPLALVMAGLGDLDIGKSACGFLGAFLVGLSYLALGLFVSSLVKNQIVAFLVTVSALFLFYIIAEPIVTSHLPVFMIPILQSISFNQHYASMARGVIDSRDIIYFLSTVTLFLYLNVVSLKQRKV